MGHDVFVGREYEVGVLEHHLADARATDGGLVLVDGEPGMGKTALGHELTRRARAAGMVTCWGRVGRGIWPNFQRPLTAPCRVTTDCELHRAVRQCIEARRYTAAVRSPGPTRPAVPARRCATRTMARRSTAQASIASCL